jgi:poly(ADP-ribose) glycohydrolase ARH3
MAKVLKVQPDIVRDSFRGSFIGTFIGDALGMPVEGMSAEHIERQYGLLTEMVEARLGRGTYTDDTQMMIGVAESLVRYPEFDGGDMIKTFMENFQSIRGYGYGTKRVLALVKSGVDWRKASGYVFKGGSYGNGAAMRIAPVGCLLWNQQTKIPELAKKTSSLTHNHKLAIEGATLVAVTIAEVILARHRGGLKKEEIFKALNYSCASKEYKSKLTQINFFLQQEISVKVAAKQLGVSSISYESVPTAIYAFLANAESFEKALISAVNVGGDADTIGAITGAIAGAYHGLSQIPNRWLDCLEDRIKGKTYVLKLADQLFNVWQKRFY